MPEQSSTDSVKSLVTKLTEACNAVGGIEKKGTNESQRYKYMKAADVAKALRRELFTRHIMLIADEKEFTQTGVVTTKMGAELREFTLRVDYHILDGDSGEKLIVGAFGVAMDSGDKSVYKAKTGALKYFLRGLGLIPDEKDDPEADEKVDKALEVNPELLAKMKKQERITQEQVTKVWEAMKRTGRTELELVAKLAAKKLTQLEQVTQELFPAVINWANGAPQAIREYPPLAVIEQKDLARVFAQATERGVPQDDVRKYAHERHQVKSMKDLTKPQLQEVLEWVQGA